MIIFLHNDYKLSYVLFVPYLLWCLFASYFTFYIVIFN
ncbi:tryptophan-rich sensory protein [Brachyspira alvinipulli]